MNYFNNKVGYFLYQIIDKSYNLRNKGNDVTLIKCFSVDSYDLKIL